MTTPASFDLSRPASTQRSRRGSERPRLPAGPDAIREQPRDIPVVQACDVCVLGGSCTGVFAAVRAAQLGGRVALIEENEKIISWA